TNNATNLEEALNIPGFHRFYSSNTSFASYGSLGVDNLAIYKDDIPLIMDHNTGYDLRAIPVWDIAYIEVHFAPNTAIVKNSSGIVIKLISKKIKDQPVGAQVSLINTSASDFHVNTVISLSNKIHTGQIGLNRSFTTPVYMDASDRGSIISAAERYDINLKYTFKILNSVNLAIGSDHSILNSQDRGEIIKGTTRVRDINQSFRRHNLYGTLVSDLSKNHKLTLNGLIHRYTDKQTSLDKDLSTGKQQEYPGTDGPFTTGYDQGYLNVLLESQNKAFNYTLGVEVNNIRDNIFSNIDAISPEYADYSAIGMFEYAFKESFVLQGGAKFLTNSLTQSYFLPNGRITLAPNKTVQLVGSYQKSISYPLFSEIFYPTEMTNGPQNNIQILPSDINTSSVKVVINKNKVKLHSGFIYISKSKEPRTISSGDLANVGQSSSTATFASLLYSSKHVNLRPSLVLHGINSTRDTGSLSFFYPEANIFFNGTLPNTKLKLSATARLLGKHSTTYLVDNSLYLREIEENNSISISASHLFIDDKLNIRFGINNLRNSTYINESQYLLDSIDRTLLSQQSVIANRGRSFFFKLQYNIK
ncbi:MAG: hypothetical protein ACPGYY_06375, partial [Bacteroidia bacterium]